MLDSLMFRKVLSANAVFSIASGLAMILFRESIAAMLDFAHPGYLIPVGLGVLIFGIQIAVSARRDALKLAELKFFALMDLLWVIGSIVLALAVPLPTSGFWLVIGTALIVTDFGILEFIGIRSIASEAS